MARIEFTREAFDPAQLREGANSTGGIGGCPVAGFGYLTPTTFALAPHGGSPSKAGLRRKTTKLEQSNYNGWFAAARRGKFHPCSV